ncbi:uncharacterized protein LOC134193151 [Corticium candelabrum]|uniref:uncharacterized protein LOC134193151 n=1 Tax=Corticium candelabrum TaxID=121492 RepID=UPI002E26DCB3|nr:uncharacterized protein LOC134193151 [Corticium candelabrum]
MDDRTLRHAAGPLIDLESQHDCSVCLGRVCKVFAVLTVITGIFAFDTSYRVVCIVGRLTSKKFLPNWDFTELYDVDCLIDNPYFAPGSRKVDCSVCNDLEVDGMEVLESADSDEIFDEFLKVGRPVVVRGQMSDWPCMMPESRLDGQKIRKLYSNNINIKTVPCHFTVPYSTSDKKISDVLQHMERGEQVLAGWENCDLRTANVLRAEYRKPPCLSGVTEMSNTNWIFVAVNGSTYPSWNVLPEFEGHGVWIAVIDGELEVTVHPQAICQSSCKSMTRILVTGDILLYTTEMWYVELSHRVKDEAVGIASTVTWNVA